MPSAAAIHTELLGAIKEPRIRKRVAVIVELCTSAVRMLDTLDAQMYIQDAGPEAGGLDAEREPHDRESLEAITRQLVSIAPVSTPLGSRPAYYSDAQVAGVPVPVYAPGSEADMEIRTVTDELLNALGVN